MTVREPLPGCDVSVLIPSFNSSPHLAHSVASALAQDGIAIEVLVQDGGSTDGSLDALTALADPRLDWISEPDGGQSDALNRALGRARGDYVIWLNADDLLTPGAGRALLAAARRHGCDVVHGSYEIIDAGGEVIKPYTSAPLERARLIRYGTYIFSGALLIDRRLLLKIGCFDDHLHYCMDYDLLLRIARSGARTGRIADVVAQFRRQPESKSESVWLPFVREHLRVARRHGATRLQIVRSVVFTLTYLALRPLWRSSIWLRIRPRKHLGGAMITDD